MSSPLYTLDILRLAAATGETPRLIDAGVTVERRSITCGSSIVVDVALDADGLIVAYGHDVRACALGQASATLFARSVIGKRQQDLEKFRDALDEYLVAEGAAPAWPGIEALAPARGRIARHASMRLAVEATIDALRRSRPAQAA